jgi:hypothetical protein
MNLYINILQYIFYIIKFHKNIINEKNEDF